ncbi:autotransporter-associated beta strand repeat-containing protein [Aminobacter anthyllidis]|uniref:Autotransporter-associated beta strand repeat-containing protein n=1 Tax=Aminobacter anthyllidis TaxID=1035067 RepID=A0A9X1ADR3_9HYPH|nr:autotransporter-associated beta strand repeat-containing protein [Aminobacter anthyllidis]
MSSTRSRNEAAQHATRDRSAPSRHGLYRAALLTCTALVAPLVMTAAAGPAVAQTTGADGGNGGNGSGTRAGGTGMGAVLAAGGNGGGGGQSGNGQPSGTNGGNGGTNGFGGGGGGAADSGAGGGAGNNGAGGGGGGGGGGAGLVINSGNVTVSQDSTGGKGGKGGYGGVQIGGTSIAGGGGGGGGGSGIVIGGTSGSTTVTVGAGVFVRGGLGGAGEAGNSNGGPGGTLYPRDHGVGGSGGHGISVTDPNGATIIVNGDVTGVEGAGGGGWNGNRAASGASGVGIRGQNLNITIGTAGAIRRTLSGQDAIYITGGTNSINSLGSAPNQGTVQGAIHLGAGVTTISGTYSYGTRPTWVLIDGGAEMKVQGASAANNARSIYDLKNYGLVTVDTGRSLSLDMGTNFATMNVASGATLETTNGGFVNNGTVNVADTGTVSAAGGWTNETGATLNFNGRGTLSGGWGQFVNRGTVNVKNGDVTASNVTFNNNGTLSLTGGNLTGIGELTNGTGGSIDIGAGRTLSLATLTSTGGSATGAGTIEASTAFNFNAGSYATKLTGTAVLNKIGSGTVTLTGTNTYTGGTNLSGGMLSVASDASLGNGALSFSGGTLNATASFATGRDATLGASGGGLSADAGMTLTYNGLLSGAGALSTSGAGTVVLGAANTYAGGTAVNAGTLRLGAGGSLLFGKDLSVAGNATFDLNGKAQTIGRLTGTGTVALGAGALTIGQGDVSSTFAGGTSGTGSLTKVGSGMLTLTGSNTHSGGTTVSGGQLQIGDGGTSGSLDGNVALASGTTLSFNRTGALTFGGVISGGGTVTMLGGGTTTLTADNTYTNGTEIYAGTLQLGNGGTSGSVLGTINNYNGTVAVNRSDTYTLANNINGNGGFSQRGTGKTILTGANTFSGGISVNAGTLSVRNAGALGNGSSAIDVAANATLEIDGEMSIDTRALRLNGTGANGKGALHTVSGESSAMAQAVLSGTALVLTEAGTGFEFLGGVDGDGHRLTIDGSGQTGITGLSGAGTELVKAGSGKLLLRGPSTYTGGTYIGGGTVEVDGAGGLGSGTVAFGGAATLRGTNAWLDNAFDLDAAATLETDNSMVLNGAISGSGSLVKTGSGDLVLNGVNSYSGGTTISAGRLTLGNGDPATLGSGAVINNAMLVLNRDGDYTLANSFSGTGTMEKQGYGTLTLSGANTMSGTTSLFGGTLQIGDGTAGGGIGSSSVIALNDSTLAFNRSNQVTFGGVLSGTGGLTQKGSGTTVLSGENSYAGTTKITAGKLQVGDGATSGKLGSGSVENGGTLTFNRSDLVTVDNAISGTGTFEQAGTGTTILTGTSSYTGATTVSAGKLLVNGSIAASSSVTVDAGATIGGSGTIATTVVNGTLSAGNSPGTLTVDGNLTLNSGSTSIFELGTSGVVGGPTNDLVIVNGDLTLGGTLETPDAVTGYYRLFNVSGSVTGSFHTLPTDAFISTSVANQVNLILRNNDQLLQFWDGSDLAGNGTVDGGSGTWSASNGNWTGAPGEATINDGWRGEVGVFAGTAGTVTVDGTLAFQGLQFTTDGYQLTGGILALSGNPFGNEKASFINTDSGVTATIASIIADGNMTELDKLGLGTLILTGDNTFTGKTTISAGTLQLGDGGTSGSVAGDIINNSVLAFNRSDDALVISGYIGGTGRLEQNGSGTTTLTGANYYTGGTTINAGTLQIGNGGSIKGDVLNNSKLVFNNTEANGEYAGDITGTGTVTLTGNSVVLMSGDISHSGGTTIDSGSVLQIGKSETTGTLSGNVSNSGTLAFDRSDDSSFDGDISGSGDFKKYGAGKLTLSGDSSGYDGIVYSLAGTLRLENSLAAGTGYIMMFGGALDYGADVDLANIMTLQQDNTVLSVASGTATHSGFILSGGGVPRAVEKTGDGTLVVKAMQHGGPTTVSEGTLKAGNANAFDMTGAMTVKADATLDLDGYDQQIGSLAGAGSVTLGVARPLWGSPQEVTLTTGGNDASTIFSGSISGAGNLSKVGSGIFTLSGTNSYTGKTWLDGGTLKAGATNSFSSASAVEVASGTELDLDGFDQVIGSLAGAGTVALGAGTLTTGGNNDWTDFSGIINGTGGLTKKGSGTFTLSGANTYSGATRIDAGTLKAGAANTIAAASAVSVGSGATFDLDGHNQTIASLAGAGNVKLGAGTLTSGDGNDTEFSGIMSGTGGLNKQGTGKLTMSGDNTHTGATSVKAGELQVNGKLGDTAVTVDSDATLSGSGTIAGSVTVSDGGHIAPGAGKGTLTVGSLSLSDDANLDFELGAQSDRIDVDGDLILDGKLNVSGGNDFGAGVYRLINYGGTLTDNGLVIGTVPGAFQASDLTIQTQVAKQINLINTGGTALAFWDGGASGNLNNGTVDGGDGTWSAASGNWTRQDGAFNAPMAPQPGYAIFQGTAGTVTVDGSQGAISVTGMQFASGYVIKGDAIGLHDAATTIRVGDGTASSAGTIATIESELTGSGGLVKDDYGTLVLSAANSYTGGTVIKGGTLSISSDGNLGAASGGLTFVGGILTNTAAMTTARDIELRLAGGTFDTRADLTASGTISGQGKLTKTGSETLTLTGTNSYAGGTKISAGTLQIGIGGTAGSIIGNVENNAVLAFNRSDLLTFAGAISGSGAVKQIGSGKTVLTGTNSYTGGTTISAGTLSGSATSFGSGAILNDAAFIIDQATDASFANAINGTGSFTKSGAGALTLTATSLLSGDTTVSAGKLSVNGSLAKSAVTVASGAVLGGTGIIGKLTAQSGSTVNAGSSIGTLSVTGDASFATGSTFQVDVDTTKSDRLSVAGKATLSGGTVQVLAGSGNYAPSTQYTILTAATGVLGQFASVTSNLAFLTPTLTYTSNAVGLSLDRNDIKFTDIAATRNQFAAGGAADRLGNKHAIYKAIVNLDKDAARKAFDALSGEVHASVGGMLVEDSRFLASAANDRIRAAFGDIGTAAALPVMAYGPDGPVIAEATTERMAFWGQAYGSWGKTGSDGNAAAFSRTTGGFIGGLDAGIGDSVRIGAFAGYSNGSFNAHDRASSGDSSAYHAGVFAGGQWEAFSLRAGAAYSWTDIETSRTVAFANFNDKLTASYDAGTTQVFGEASYRLQQGDAIVEPFAALAYINVKTDGFTEKGGQAALTASTSTTETTFATLGVRASTEIAIRGMDAKLHGMVGWRHTFGDVTPLASVAFKSGGAFTVAGAPIAKDTAIVEAGLDLTLTPDATLGVTYAGQFGSGAVDQSFRANLGVSF